MITAKELSETVDKKVQAEIDAHEANLTEFTQDFIRNLDNTLKTQADWGRRILHVGRYYPSYNFKITPLGWLLSLLTLGLVWTSFGPYMEGILIKGVGNVRLLAAECKKRGLKIQYAENPWDYSKEPRIYW